MKPTLVCEAPDPIGLKKLIDGADKTSNRIEKLILEAKATIAELKGLK